MLLLDEPTTGLDPRTRLELWESIRALVAGGTDVLLTTQYLEEADQLADHVVIIDHGRSIATGTPTELKAQAGLDMVEIRVTHGSDLAAVAAMLAPLGTEPPRLDEPGRRVLGPGARKARADSPTPCGCSPTAGSNSTTSACAARPSTRSSSPLTGVSV